MKVKLEDFRFYPFSKKSEIKVKWEDFRFYDLQQCKK